MQANAFVFETEFTSDGHVLSGPGRTHFARPEAEQMAAQARSEGEVAARRTGESAAFAGVDRIVAHLAPVQAQLAALADQLRREAAELALISASRIAGDALDRNGAEASGEAVAHVIRLLKSSPVVTVLAPPDSLPVIERRLEQLRRQGQATHITFAADPAGRPGDWRVEWKDGSTSFSRDEVEAAIKAVLDSRLSDPVEPQLELFSAA